ncbi:MAG: hypothetical protein J6K73_04355 [Clostridia bacterium]|nr:hypothetical protein [Clostridia bacterium]MBP3648998.1 hypothetical protein [Clostridia bacterium]
MKRIRISFEYQCCPVWVYDEAGYLLCNGLPDEMQSDEALAALCNELQVTYDALFVDDGKVFEYLGFASEDQQLHFEKQVAVLREKLETACGDRYRIEA